MQDRALRLKAMAVILVAVLAVGPSIGVAYPDASYAADGRTQVSFPADSASVEEDAISGAAVVPKMLAVAEIAEWEDVLDPDGASALELWLAGEELADDQLFSIDVEALRPIDADLAERIRLEQEQRIAERNSGGYGGSTSRPDGYLPTTVVVSDDPEISGSSGAVNPAAGSDEDTVRGITGKVKTDNVQPSSNQDTESAEGVPAYSEWT